MICRRFSSFRFRFSVFKVVLSGSSSFNEAISSNDKYPSLRTTTISANTGIPIKSVERLLSELSRVGMVCYQGSKKTGWYHLVNQSDDL